MQSRIMELASQREFYIAINTKLQQTLTDHDLVRLPNGVQPIATVQGGGAVGIAMGGGDGLHPQHLPQAMAAISSGHATSAGGGGIPNSGIYEEESRIQQDNSRVLENSSGVVSGVVLMDTDNSDERMLVSSTAIPKEAQDSLLHAHFSSMQRGTGGGGRRVKSSGLTSGSKHPELPEGLESDPMLSSVAEPPNQQNNSGGGGTSGRVSTYSGHSRHTTHEQRLVNNSNNVMMSSFSRSSSGGSRHSHHHHHDQERHAATTELLSSSHQLLESGGDRLAAPPNNEGGTTPSLNEVTHVTAAVQRPIASFGSPLNDTSPMLSSAVGHPQSSNNVYFHHNPSS